MKLWRRLLIGSAGMCLLLLTACQAVQPMDESIVLPKPIPPVYASDIDAEQPDLAAAD